MASLADHIAARQDADLAERVVAAVERADMPNSQAWTQANIGRVVSIEIGSTTIADVHSYAVATYDPPPRPGENPAAVTDQQIMDAVAAVVAEDAEVPPPVNP